MCHDGGAWQFLVGGSILGAGLKYESTASEQRRRCRGNFQAILSRTSFDVVFHNFNVARLHTVSTCGSFCRAFESVGDVSCLRLFGTSPT